MYSFFEPELPPSDALCIPKMKPTDGGRLHEERRAITKLSNSKSNTKSSHSKSQRPTQNSGAGRRSSPETTSWNVLDLKKENYFSCAVNRSRTSARYLLKSTDQVVALIKELAEHNSISP